MVEQSGVGRRLPMALRLLLLGIFLPIYCIVLAVYYLSLVAVFVPLWLVFYSARVLLYPCIWWRWCGHGRCVLFVYSNSPNSQEYIEQRLLPKLGERAVVLNWSQRGQRKRTLPLLTFRLLGGSRQQIPAALVFRPFRPARWFCFREPLRQFKQGMPEALARLEGEMFAMVDKIGRTGNGEDSA
jgi:hypothetical protein